MAIHFSKYSNISEQDNVYLYNRDNKILYEISYFMNFSPININFSEREKIFNLLFFQILFVFLN
jgi:hypothetical protein